MKKFSINDTTNKWIKFENRQSDDFFQKSFDFLIINACLNSLISLLQCDKDLWKRFLEINDCLHWRHSRNDLKKATFMFLNYLFSISIDWHMDFDSTNFLLKTSLVDEIFVVFVIAVIDETFVLILFDDFNYVRLFIDSRRKKLDVDVEKDVFIEKLLLLLLILKLTILLLLTLLTIDHFLSNWSFVIELIQKHNEKNVKLKLKNMKSQLHV